MPRLTYYAPPSDALRIVRLDALTAIYHRSSGQTHIVADPIPQILGALANGAMTAEMLAEHLGVESDERPGLEARLAELVGTGLIATI